MHSERRSAGTPDGMEVVAGIDALRALVREWRRRGERVALVPTMGNLHQGHFALVEDAARRADRVIVSIFVNPTQFGPQEDFASYPRTLESDCEQLRGMDVAAVFAPSVTTMYPDDDGGLLTRVDVPALTGLLCGAARPGHFAGVAAVVTKLLNIAAPDIAVFGRKDYQQLRVIHQVAADLNLPVEIVGSPVIREADGLAMSSRNAYLTEEQRALAPALYQALRGAAAGLQRGEPDPRGIETRAWQRLETAGLQPEYISVANPHTLLPAAAGATAVVIVTAAWLGRARLIDNIEVGLTPDFGASSSARVHKGIGK